MEASGGKGFRPRSNSGPVDSRVRVVFHGLVQGVNFRHYARVRALELDLRGWVRNLEDGTVEAVAEGPRRALEEWIRWSREDQPMARVSEVETEWSKAKGAFDRFTIQR